MNMQNKPTLGPGIIPSDAPFSDDQRSWLNGFFAGLLSLDTTTAAAAGVLPDQVTQALSGDGDDGEDPWHDASIPIGERMEMAEGRPVRRKVYAAMAQQDCGQCGYLCESYAEAIVGGEEARLNLCVPGGKETSRMLKQLAQELAAPTGESAAAPDTAAAAVSTDNLEEGYCRERPVDTIFRGTTPVTLPGSAKDTRHVVFDISNCVIDYEPGDSFGIYASNAPDLVDQVLAAIDAPPDFPIADKPLRECLLSDYDLGEAPDALFELASYFAGGARRQKVKALARGDDPEGDATTYDVLKTVEEFGPMRPDPEAFLECLEPLQPRLYSISSSPLASPGELHLTVDTVRYDVDARQRLGVASTFLADRMPTDTPVKAYLQKAHDFALPADPKTPIIMVGPGTGIAPFRSFLWHRHTQSETGPSWLFFGHQREATDFFYRDEIVGFLDAGTLAKLSTAWSRDGAEKVYVQDLMRQEGEELWTWLSQGAHFYVCGDAQRMAKDVDNALVHVLCAHGGLSEDDAISQLKSWRSEGRYQTDVY